MNKHIVITGATGTIGRRVVEGLVAKGASITALAHSAGKTRELEALGAKVAVGSFEDAASLERAFAGADTLVLITAANEHAAEQTLTAIEAAKRAKLRKIVRISALHANVDGPTDNTRQHGRTEAALRASGLTFVILRPHLFMQNLLGSVQTILDKGQIYAGVGDGKTGMVDTRDVSDAAIVAAATDAFDGETLELTGPASLHHREVAAAITRGLGREVTYVPVPPAQFAEGARAWGANDWLVRLMRDYSTAYSGGFGDFTTGDVQRITGHAPRSIDDFIREVLVPATVRPS